MPGLLLVMKTPQPQNSLDLSEEAGVRSLHFGSQWIQGAMRIRKPDALEIKYTREMLACLLWKDWTLWPREVLLIIQQWVQKAENDLQNATGRSEVGSTT